MSPSEGVPENDNDGAVAIAIINVYVSVLFDICMLHVRDCFSSLFLF